jgi:hypothetical protein
MSIATPSLDEEFARMGVDLEPETSPLRRSLPLTVAGIASLGAGAIHAAAVGGHAGLDQVVLTFIATAIVQLLWGALAIAQPARVPALIGALLNGCFVGGWVLSKTGGIGFIEGLEAKQSPALADSLAAGLAAGAVLGALLSVARPALGRRFAPPVTAVIGLTVLVLGAVGMDAAASPNHHSGSEVAAGADHHATDGTAAGAVHVPSVARPYDPALPIDLGGIDGVSSTQQAAAENLIANTLSHLPQYADPAVAEAAGYATISDGGTGYEHFINADYQGDGRVLDPDRPESLVYQIIDGQRTLVAAMYMAEPGTTLETVPELGGPLTQWHVHGDLCFTPPPNSRVAGLTDADGSCAAGLVRPEPVPMIHVWIRSHPCGPFAALEGIAGGQIPEGESRLCDAAHGGH